MNLSSFIIGNMEEILIEWEAFAKQVQPESGDMSSAELRDHGKQILEEISREVDCEETDKEKCDKSKGLKPDTNQDSAASEHGTVRHASGFTMPQVISEYRAMRASVLKLWMPKMTSASEQTWNEIFRFNEAIDKALAESAMTYGLRANRTRDTFLAILGHDLRSPLATITMAGDYLSKRGEGAEIVQIGARVKRSAATMTAMVHDLIEYARVQLDGKIPISRNLADMEQICQAAMDDASAAYPACAFRLEKSGLLLDDFDSARLQQVFSNLLSNAAQYRGKNDSVIITAKGEVDKVTVQVKNNGQVIPPESLKAIFDPLVQLAKSEDQQGRATTSLGLGLFIARVITEAHGGKIDVTSSEEHGTIFTVTLLRTQPSNEKIQ